jgi:hypothetical protein
VTRRDADVSERAPVGPSGGEPPRGGNRAVRWIIGVFLLCATGVAVWGGFVAAGTRATAARTDLEVRQMAWVLLSAAVRDGRFPQSESELIGAAALPALAEIPPDPLSPPAWPSLREEALEGRPVPEAPLREILTRVRVAFDGDGPPRVAVAGLPTRLRTLPLVNGWIAAFADAHPDTLAAPPGSGD